MKYTEFKDMLQKKVDDLPMIFAFSNEQFDRALDDMGLSLQDMKGDKLIRMGFGAFCLKSELEHIRGELDKVDDMKREFISGLPKASLEQNAFGTFRMTKLDKIYKALKTIFEFSIFLAMVIVPWFLLAFVVWVRVAW